MNKKICLILFVGGLVLISLTPYLFEPQEIKGCTTPPDVSYTFFNSLLPILYSLFCVGLMIVGIAFGMYRNKLQMK